MNGRGATSGDTHQLIVITAPSGAGKSTLIRDLLEHAADLEFCVSHTTRSPREGEVHGKDYYFTDRSEFQEMARRGDFLEWAEVHGNLYGTSHTEITRLQQSGKRAVLDIDVQGARTLMSEGVDAQYIFISVSDISLLERRLRKRGTDSEAVIKQRVENARHELDAARNWPVVVCNDDLESARGRLREILKI